MTLAPDRGAWSASVTTPVIDAVGLMSTGSAPLADDGEGTISAGRAAGGALAAPQPDRPAHVNAQASAIVWPLLSMALS
jgi:hypothetical protein